MSTNGWLIELRFDVTLDTEHVNSETFFPANLLAQYWRNLTQHNKTINMGIKAQLLYTMQHRTVLIIFHHNIQKIITAQMFSIKGEGDSLVCSQWNKTNVGSVVNQPLDEVWKLCTLHTGATKSSATGGTDRCVFSKFMLLHEVWELERFQIASDL